MQCIQIEDLQAETAEVMVLEPLCGLALTQALNVARIEYSQRLRAWQMWAVRPTNQAALDAAAARLQAVAHVVRVLCAALEAERETAAPEARCPWHRAIRRFYAIAQEKGLNPRADAAMREAIGCYWSIDVASRAQLTAGQWLAAGDAVRLGALVW